MNNEKAMSTLEEACEMLMDSLAMAIEENKPRGVIDCNHAPLVRDLMIALEKDLRAKEILMDLEGAEMNEEQGTFSRSYMAGERGNYGRQRRRNNGRYMDDGSNTNNVYSAYGHDDSKEVLRRIIQRSTDPAERRALEEAMNSI